jgi:hypothetical protein
MTTVGAVGNNKPVQTLEEYFGGASLLGSGADLAMVVFGLQIQQMENDVVDEIKKIEDAGKVREAMNDRMTQLRAVRDLIRGIDAKDKDGFVELHHLIEQMNAKGMDLGLLQQMDFHMNADGSVEKKVGKPLIGAENAFDKDGKPIPLLKVEIPTYGVFYNINGKIQPDAIDSEVKRLEGEAQKLDQNREIKMIMLNQQLNKKEQAVTQLTNIIKKTHDTRSAIINNLK